MNSGAVITTLRQGRGACRPRSEGRLPGRPPMREEEIVAVLRSAL